MVCASLFRFYQNYPMDRLVSKNRYTYQTHNGKKDRIHRHIMEEHIGRFLRINEHVYHLNGDPKDNRIENLAVITKKCQNAS